MNIFYLSYDPHTSARMMCDEHVRKMIVESAQLLSTAHHVLDGADVRSGLYKPTHVNHPCAVWVRSSRLSYRWLYDHFVSLLYVYENGTGRKHKTSELLKPLKFYPRNLKSQRGIEPPRCMPDFCKLDRVPDSYQMYYKHKSSKMRMTWKYNNEPHFMDTPMSQYIGIQVRHLPYMRHLISPPKRSRFFGETYVLEELIEEKIRNVIEDKIYREDILW